VRGADQQLRRPVDRRPQISIRLVPAGDGEMQRPERVRSDDRGASSVADAERAPPGGGTTFRTNAGTIRALVHGHGVSPRSLRMSATQAEIDAGNRESGRSWPGSSMGRFREHGRENLRGSGLFASETDERR
jgi:hypothetical protein